MQIPIVSGIYTGETADFRTSLPHNYLVTPKPTGISDGYLRPHEGIERFDTFNPTSGVGRGAFVWRGIAYAVVGTDFVRIANDGVVTVIGAVADGGWCQFDNSFDRMSIGSGGKLYYYDGVSLQQVTDPDLGISIDHCFAAGRFISTDGEFISVSDLTDPFSWDPLKYGSSEYDPDPVTGVMLFRNELLGFNRFTIETFQNVGGDNFPYAVVEGAVILKGALSASTKCAFAQSFAFVGSGEDESISVYMGGGGVATKIATQEVEDILEKYSEATLAGCVLEARESRVHQMLYLSLPNETLVYDLAASSALGNPVWTVLGSNVTPDGAYRARGFVRAYNKWICCDRFDNRIGELDISISTQYGNIVGRRIDTPYLYSDAKSGIIHQLELVGTTGRQAFGDSAGVFVSWSIDGRTWSDEKIIDCGNFGDRSIRPALTGGVAAFERFISIRIRTADKSIVTWARLEGEIEGLFI